MQEYLPLPPLSADQLPPALVLGGGADPLVDATDVEVRATAACCAGVFPTVPVRFEGDCASLLHDDNVSVARIFHSLPT